VINPDGTVHPSTGLRADLLLGVRPDVRRRESEVVLHRDSVVILYTDGLVERRDRAPRLRAPAPAGHPRTAGPVPNRLLTNIGPTANTARAPEPFDESVLGN
jgi:hypothetical protein